MNLPSFIGYVGAAMILLAYGQVSRGAWHGKSRLFQLVNFGGAAGLTFYAAAIKAYPNVLLNGIWLLVAIIALWRLWRPGRKP